MGHTRSLVRFPQLLLATLLVLAGFGAFATSAAAQDEPTSLNVIVWECLEPGCTEDPELVEGIDGVDVTATDADTEAEIGSCTTGDTETGACVIEVPSTVTNVTLTLDEATFPEGLSATDNPATFSLEDTTEYQFLLMPEGGFPPDDDPTQPPAATEPPAGDDDEPPVSSLPETGAGDHTNTSGVLVASLIAVASVTGLLAMVTRRALGRR